MANQIFLTDGTSQVGFNGLQETIDHVENSESYAPGTRVHDGKNVVWTKKAKEK